MEYWASVLSLHIGTIRTAELLALSVGRSLPPREIVWYSFLLEAEWIPEILNKDRRTR
jgi:hypothetical protein